MTEDQRRSHGHLEPEREPAARRYAAAIAALDAAGEPSPTVATSAAAAAADVVRLSQVWNKYEPSPGDGPAVAIAKRVLAELARLLPWRRRRLHGAMLAAIGRNAETTRALIDAVQHFESHVIWYAQTIAAFASGGRSSLGSPADVAALHRAIEALGSDWLMHWESLAAREQRYDARMASLMKSYDDLRQIAGLAQQSTLSLKRTVEMMAGGERSMAPAPPASPTPESNTDAFKYVVFEDRFRGSRDEIRRRLTEYLPVFAGASNVLEIGCGRGELLELFQESGISARGVDLNDEMVEACRTRGVTADRADALAFLAAQPDQSLGGLIAIQVVEHLDPNYLMRLIETGHHKLRPGAALVLETINAACWAAFFDSYIRDFTHVHPLHPDTLRYLVQACGFSSVDVRYLSPIADHEKLPSVRIAPEGDVSPAVVELTAAVNAHADRLNSQLFTFRDFAIVGRR